MMRIGELLVMNGLISESQLEQALERQKENPAKLGELLIESGAITERQLVEALEFQHGISVLESKDLVSRGDCTRLVPDELVHRHILLPIEQSGRKLSVAFYDPSPAVMDELRKATGLEIQPFLATRSDLEQVIRDKYGASETVRQWHAIVGQAVSQRIAAFWIDPHDDGLLVRTRRDKQLVTLATIPPQMKTDMIRTIKRQTGLNPDSDLPQEGRVEMEIGHAKVTGRVFTLPHASGESFALHVKQRKTPILQTESLGIDEQQLNAIRERLRQSGRMVLVTSPPAQGTTSMIHALLGELAGEGRKCFAVETWTEPRLDGVYHLACNLERGFTVADGIRGSMRHDPDILAIDADMNRETFESALQAALAGPLVIAGGRGESALDCLRRLIQQNVDRKLLASGLSMIVNQKVIRKLCTQCLQTVTASDEELQLFEKEGLLHAADADKTGSKPILGNFRTFINSHKPGRLPLYRGEGCKLCDGTGYRGETATHEVLIVDETLREFIGKGRGAEEIAQHVMAKGEKTHLYYGLRKVKEGVTTFEEVLKADGQKKGMGDPNEGLSIFNRG